MRGQQAGRGSLVRWSDHRVFRSVEEWKSALMTLPSNSFFELLRSIFGNIKTPFSKQRLLDDLFILLSREEIRKTIAVYIDEKDQKIIAAVALLNEPSPGDMESFFAGEFSWTELHAVLVNLEERLILYRYRDEGIMRLALNPVLEQVLAPFIADTTHLFPSFPVSQSFSSGSREASGSGAQQKSSLSLVSIPDGRIMAALFALIFNEEELFKVEGGIRKKILDEGKNIFPNLDLEFSVRVLLALGLFRLEGRGLIPCRERIADFSELSSIERQEYWTAGVYICLNELNQDGNFPGTPGSPETGPDSPAGQSDGAGTSGGNNGNPPGEVPPSGIYSRNRLRGIALFLHRFKSLIDPERKYPEITLRRFGELLEKDDKEQRNSLGFDSKPPLPFDALLAVMERTGLLERTETFWKAGPGQIVPVKSDTDKETKEPVIAMDAAFSIILYPEISFADALMLGTFCSVKEKAGAEPLSRKEAPAVRAAGTAETAIYFELTRQSVMRGFDQGISADAMTKLLERLSLNRIDANLGWTLREWESRYAGVSLHQGVILTLAEDRRYLAEAEPVASLIRRKLAPGVYLLSSEERSEAVRALRRAGVDIVAQPPLVPADKDSFFVPGIEAERFRTIGFSRNSFPRLQQPAGDWAAGLGSDVRQSESPQSPPGSLQESAAIREKFHRILEKMLLTKPEQDELAARIERRLVLSDAQLEKASLRYEKLEARGLDYSGKLAIAKQAAESGSLVEISWPSPGGGTNRTAGIVQSLEKKEGESILILKSFYQEEGKTETSMKDLAGIAADSKDAGLSSGEKNVRVLRIPLAKISLLRRIKQSIFGE